MNMVKIDSLKLVKMSIQIENNFISNWDELKIEGAPLVVGGIKFAPNQKSDLWSDFSDSDWFIPKIAIL